MKKILLILISAAFIFGCSDSSGNGQEEVDATSDVIIDTTTDTPVDEIPGTYTMGTSKAQKGPLESGSTVTIQELDSNLEPVGNAYFTQTEGRFGVFENGSTLTLPDIDVSVLGYYFNENIGSISGSHIVLRTYSDISINNSVVVNVLTTLSYMRIKYLVTEESKTIAEARTMAESEIMAIFNIDTVTDGFDQMDISIDDSKGGVLLAISVILQQGNTTGEVHTLISDIALDIKSDGILNSQTIIDELSSNAQAVDTAAIAINVQSYYAQYGLDITVAEYINYIDSDGDGILNLNDDDIPDVFVFTQITDAELSTLLESNIITISGLADGGTVSVIGTAYKNGVSQTDFLISNGDTLQLKLTSDDNYSTVVSTQFSIGGVNYNYSVTTKDDDRDQIIVFDSGQPAMDGAFGYANAQSWCETEATNQGLTGTIIPWLSSDAFDVGTDFIDEITEDAVNPRQVQSLVGGLIATRWTKFFDAESTDTFGTLGVVNDGYWTGMVSGPSYDGRTTYNCNQWQNNGSTINNLDYGNYNRHDIADRTTEGDPQGVNTTTCDTLRKILCIAF